MEGSENYLFVRRTPRSSLVLQYAIIAKNFVILAKDLKKTKNNLQVTNKLQIKNHQIVFWWMNIILVIGSWILFVIWDMLFVIFVYLVGYILFVCGQFRLIHMDLSFPSYTRERALNSNADYAD